MGPVNDKAKQDAFRDDVVSPVAWKNTGRVDKLAAQAMSFAEVKELLDVEEFLKLRERL